MPFDIIIEPLQIIVEVDGEQHFKEVKHFKRVTLKQVQARDRFKEKRAKKKGYSVIRIKQDDVWYNRFDWQKRLVVAIDYVTHFEKPYVLKLWKEE